MSESAELPGADQAFDPVMSEVLEYGTAALYPELRAEVARVADRYILMTVPNRGNLTHVGSMRGLAATSFTSGAKRAPEL